MRFKRSWPCFRVHALYSQAVLLLIVTYRNRHWTSDRIGLSHILCCSLNSFLQHLMSNRYEGKIQVIHKTVWVKQEITREIEIRKYLEQNHTGKTHYIKILVAAKACWEGNLCLWTLTLKRKKIENQQFNLPSQKARKKRPIQTLSKDEVGNNKDQNGN